MRKDLVINETVISRDFFENTQSINRNSSLNISGRQGNFAFTITESEGYIDNITITFGNLYENASTYTLGSEETRIVQIVWSQDTLPFGGEVTTIQSPTEQIHNSTYIYDTQGSILARIDENNNTYLYHTDTIGSVVAVTTNNTNTTITNPFQFSGKEWDGDTRLFYFGARYYDPSIGRFITVDPILSDTNPYSYAENNPLVNVDVNGEYSSAKKTSPFLPNLPPGKGGNPELLALKDMAEEFADWYIEKIYEPVVMSLPTMFAPVGGMCTRVMYYLGKCGEALRGEGGFVRIGSPLELPPARGGFKGVWEPPASAPVGHSGMRPEWRVNPGTNPPGRVGDLYYTGHAFDQMQGRGIPPSAVENAIRYGKRLPGDKPGTIKHVSEDVMVVTRLDKKTVITVRRTGSEESPFNPEPPPGRGPRR